MNREVYEQYRPRSERVLDGIVMVLTWIVFLAIGVAVGLVIGYVKWKGGETP